MGDIHNDGCLRLEAKGRCLRPSEGDFFLGGRDRGNGCGWAILRKQAQSF
jgi:hypothetical protein